jgi:hypothetical protein
MAGSMQTEPFWRSVGPWLAAVGAALMFVNAGRAYADPAAFALYLGLPLSDPGDARLVHVYASRALFIGLAIAALLAARLGRALAIVALAAIVMPVGDAWLTAQAGAPAGTVARHVGIAAFLIVTGALLARGSCPTPRPPAVR